MTTPLALFAFTSTLARPCPPSVTRPLMVYLLPPLPTVIRALRVRGAAFHVGDRAGDHVGARRRRRSG